MLKRKADSIDSDNTPQLVITTHRASPRKYRSDTPLTQPRTDLVGAILHGCYPAAMYYISQIETHDTGSKSKNTTVKTKVNQLLMCSFFQLVGPAGADIWAPLTKLMRSITNVSRAIRPERIHSIVAILCGAPKNFSIEAIHASSIVLAQEYRNQSPNLEHLHVLIAELVSALVAKLQSAYIWAQLILQHPEFKADPLFAALNLLDPALTFSASLCYKPLRENKLKYLPIYMWLSCYLLTV